MCVRFLVPPSSRGLGRQVLILVTPVRIRLGVLFFFQFYWGFEIFGADLGQIEKYFRPMAAVVARRYDETRVAIPPN